ncbi:MAG: NAD(P)/FAD-dependent oxidoreductase [Candidatus Hodarchaeales archaeon]
MPETSQSDIVIVGAGTAGSYFAWQMAQKGYKTTVIEKRKLGTLGEHIDIFHVDSIRFEQFGIPLPEGEELIAHHEDGLAWPPDGDSAEYVDYAFHVMRLPLFIQRLQKYAVDAGAVIHDKTVFTKPFFEKDKLTGVIANRNGEEIVYRASVVVDCSGTASAVRVSLPVGYGIEIDPINPEDMLYVILQYWDEIKGDDFPRGLNFYPYHKTFCNPSYGDGAILGVGQPGSYELSKKVQEEFLRERFQYEHRLIKTAKGTTPYRRSPFSIVADNFIVLGDAAFMTKPFSGEGVTSGFTACQISAEELDHALKSGDTSRESLWRINTRYFRDQGAKFSELFAQLPAAAELSRKDVNYLFKKGVIFSGKALTNMNKDFENPISFTEIISMAFKLLWGVTSRQFSFKSLRKLLGALSVSGAMRKHYERYPEDPDDFVPWVEKAAKLWDRV